METSSSNTGDAVHIEPVTDPVVLTEGPHWVEEDQVLLFVEPFKGNAHRLFTQTGRHQVLHVEDVGSGPNLTVIVPVDGAPDLFVVTLGRSFAVVEWKHSDPDYHVVTPVVLQTVDEHNKSTFFNDGKCDPSGRLWSGTMDKDLLPEVPTAAKEYKAALFCLTPDLNVKTWVTQVALSNGLCWSSEKLKVFYYIDSYAYSVDAFDYDGEAGEIKNRRVVLNYKAAGLTKDLPDGMTIDTEGRLWVANFRGSKVVCIDPKLGRIVRQVDFPCQNITSVCWGGPNYDVLYVTSAYFTLSNEEHQSQPSAGAVFAVTGLGAKGKPPMNFKADLTLLREKIALHKQ
ncbi:regucalcin-like [Oratosquilla oratoria]|uniref:regucalcin-like n=1 Tax=Oratosquilla oratoria TaxID=337810 RepID=UPI003F7688CF